MAQAVQQCTFLNGKHCAEVDEGFAVLEACNNRRSVGSEPLFEIVGRISLGFESKQYGRKGVVGT